MANVVTWAGRSIYNNRLMGNGTEPLNIGWGVGADTGSAFPDVNMFQAATSATYYGGSNTRVVGTGTLLSSNQLGDTFQVVGTITAASVVAVTEVALFDSTTLSPQITANSTAANATATTIGTTGATGIAVTAGNYYAQWDNEVILVTGGQNSNTLTVTRGALGSTATTHLGGSYITAGGDGGAHAANSSIGGETWVPTGANGGSMFVHADFSVISLAANDGIQFTLTTQLA